MRNIHREDEFLHIGEIKDGKAYMGSEAHYRAEQGLGSIRVTGKVVSVSGAVVDGSEIKARCKACKGYEAEIRRCSVCGDVFCLACICKAHDQLFCADHLAEYLENFSTWRS